MLSDSLSCLSVTRGGFSRSGLALAVPAGVLLIGVLVYLLDRPVGSAPFFAPVSVADRFPTVFGVLGLSFPTFAHTFTFSALTAMLMGGRRKATAVACLTWLAVEGAFEIGQSAVVATWLAALIPTRFESVPILSQTSDYFVNGTYDPWDLLSIGIGAVTAYYFVAWASRESAYPAKAEDP